MGPNFSKMECLAMGFGEDIPPEITTSPEVAKGAMF